MSKLSIQDFQSKIINWHTHTTRCQHAKGEDREYVEKAIEAGYDILGFSDHAPLVYEDDFVPRMRMHMHELEGYVDSVLSLKKEYVRDIEIYCGLEMEFFPRFFDKAMVEIDKYPIDYMILGQHYYDEDDGPSPKRICEDEAQLEVYVERVLGGLATDRFLYVAHPDLVNFAGENSIYRKHMGRMVDEFKRRGMPLEINMNGFRSGSHYPNPELIKIGVEKDVDFIIGVDAHAPKELLDFETYENCKKLVLQMGGRVINSLK